MRRGLVILACLLLVGCTQRITVTSDRDAAVYLSGPYTGAAARGRVQAGQAGVFHIGGGLPFSTTVVAHDGATHRVVHLPAGRRWADIKFDTGTDPPALAMPDRAALHGELAIGQGREWALFAIGRPHRTTTGASWLGRSETWQYGMLPYTLWVHLLDDQVVGWDDWRQGP